MYRAFFMRLIACSAVSAASFVIFEGSLGAFLVPGTKTQSPSTPVGATNGKFQEPAKSDYYYYLDQETETLSPLELQVSKARAKSRDLGFGGVRGGYDLSGGRSFFRIKAGQRQEFLIRFDAVIRRICQSEEAMKAYVFLSPASSKSGRRDVITVQWPFIGRPKINEDRILCDLKSYGDGSVLIAPHEALPAGEYAFILADPHYSAQKETALFAFGIDPPTMN
jgi:hypothetical protein